MYRRFSTWLPLLAVTLLLAGCGGTDSPATVPPPIGPTVTPTSVATPSPAASPTSGSTVIHIPTTLPPASAGPGNGDGAVGTIPADAVTAVANARAALAAAAGLDPATISVGTVTPAEWPNGALGCEQPGRAYIAVISPGYVVELIHGTTRTLYHAGRTAGAVTCADAGP